MKKKVNKKEAKQQKEFKNLVLGKAGRKKKGAWDVMYGGQPDLKEKKKKKNFWVDTDIWFKQDY